MIDAHLEILAPGLLTSVQDSLARTRFGRLGVRPGGAMDVSAAELANRLVGNIPAAAVLEATLVGPTLQIVGHPRVVAVTGADLAASLNDRPLTPGWGVLVPPGTILSFGERRAGARAYVAFSGGIDVPLVLGSRSTDLLSGLGGFRGRALRAADVVPLGLNRRLVAGRHTVPAWAAPNPSAAVRVLAGPHLERFVPGALENLCARPWRITDRADRMGYRLAGGAPLRHVRGADVASLGLPGGAIQVPADGQPIVLLADHQPTGGYTVLATVIQADLPRLAQRGPGEIVRFTLTTLEAARDARRPEPLAVRGDAGEFAAGWA